MVMTDEEKGGLESDMEEGHGGGVHELTWRFNMMEQLQAWCPVENCSV